MPPVVRIKVLNDIFNIGSVAKRILACPVLLTIFAIDVNKSSIPAEKTNNRISFNGNGVDAVMVKLIKEDRFTSY